MDRQKDITDKARDVPLEDVLQDLGAIPDPKDPKKWITSIGSISVFGQKFYCWNQAQGAGGAIDLVMLMQSSDFRTARDWLINRYGLDNCTLAIPIKFWLPESDSNKLNRVEQYLCQKRGLPRRLLHALMQDRRIFSDSRGNAVFVLLGKKKIPVGAELRSTGSTPWRGMALGSRKNRGFFYAGDPASECCILCESAIDAISCLTLRPNALCISTSGATPRPYFLPILLNRGHKVYCGFDNDSTGQAMADQMIRLHPAVERLCPVHKDWNEDLLSH